MDVRGCHPFGAVEELGRRRPADALRAELLATARDPTHPMPDGLWPGTGSLLAAVETAAGVTADLVGKPEPQLFLTAVDRMGDGSTLVVGDRLDSDVAAAAAAGLDAALVLSGGTSRTQAEAAARDADAPQPVEVADDLASLVNGTSPTRPRRASSSGAR